MNVLLVEDEVRVADFIKRGLGAEGWLVTLARDGETALALLADNPGAFDVVVLDLMLPGIDGRDVCRKLRARQNHTPILMLSALDAADERVAGLRIGADDYLAKPFDFDELIARIEALHRRQRGYGGEGEGCLIVSGAIAFDTRSLEVGVAGETVDLTAKERDILRLFMSNPGKVFARERILSAVWGIGEDPLTNVVDVYIARLRKKLKGAGAMIQTVRGSGYRLDA